MQIHKNNSQIDFFLQLPASVLSALGRLSAHNRIYFTGGTIRDFLLERKLEDYDLTVSGNPITFGRNLAQLLQGKCIILDEEHGICRVVKDLIIDVCGFREQTQSIEEDLHLRDFTINSMAIPYTDAKRNLAINAVLIDPVGGLTDLQNSTIRLNSDQVFPQDPLRLLRAFRFAATLGFRFDPLVSRSIRHHKSSIGKISPERINHELQLIMQTSAPYRVFREMADCGLLWEIVPELQDGCGQKQPASHHLDVFDHNIAALQHMGEILDNHRAWFADHQALLAEYLTIPENNLLLKWAALFHDLGKPSTASMRQNRLTFYNHDQVGAELFTARALKLRWDNSSIKTVARLIKLHMYPFHLNNSQGNGITPRACLRLAKKTGKDMPGIFLLAMADSLAAEGIGKPAGMEKSLGRLYEQIAAMYLEQIKPVLTLPRLLTGHDLVNHFKLTPGPVFNKILAALQSAQAEEAVVNRQEALSWVTEYLKKNHLCKDLCRQ